MAGLTREGFTPEPYADIKSRISARLEAFSPSINLDSEAPDGHLVDLFSFELSQVWSELSSIFDSYNPNIATGAGLRNLGLITGLPFGAATRSQAVVALEGIVGVTVPAGSIVADDKGNEFTTTFAAVIPASVQVVATLSGAIAVPAGTITTLVSNTTGWTGITQSQDGRQGGVAQTEVQYRNLRNKTVLRNYVGVEEVIRARLLETLDIEQVNVLSNDDPTDPLPDGTPPNSIHVTIGEIGSSITDEQIAQVILETKGLVCPTYGSTTVTVNDSQGYPQEVSFSKAVGVPIFLDIEILFLDEDYAGAEESIRADLITEINSLATDEDVIWSRLFGVITPYSKAQVDKLELSRDGSSFLPANISIGADEFANTQTGYINITVTN